MNAKESVHYRNNLRLDGEDTEQANVMPVERPKIEDIHEALSGDQVFRVQPSIVDLRILML